MAIDSREKRASAASLPFMPLMPLADSTITADDRMQIASAYSLPTWTSADSHIDSESEWSDESNAYDGDTTTFAVHDTATLFTILELTFDPPIRTELYRIWAEGFWAGDTYNPDLHLWFYMNGAWYSNAMGEITKSQWHYYPCGPGGNQSVSGARILSNDSVYDYLRVYEFQLLDLDNLYVPSSRPLVGGSLATVSLIKGGLVR